MAQSELHSTRRNQISIMNDLLYTLQEPRKLTHILYKSNMSYGQLKKYLDNMITMGLIERQKYPFRTYRITSKGKLFMDIVKEGTEI